MQLTTWNPTTKDAKAPPGGPLDYASKHWSGLIKDYYAARARLVMKQAQTDAAAGKKLDTAAVDRIKAQHAYDWQRATAVYPSVVQGDALRVSQAMLLKYQPFYRTC